MAEFTSLPSEILLSIFHTLQSLKSGPRYELYPIESARQIDLENDAHDHWRLVEPGALYLSATCKTFRSFYLSDLVPASLRLQLPKPPIPEHEHRYFASTQFFVKNCNLLKHLKKTKSSNGKPLTRFMLDCRWEGRITSWFRGIWIRIMENVAQVYGDGLQVVICSHGEGVWEDLFPYAPPSVRQIENLDRFSPSTQKELPGTSVAAETSEKPSVDATRTRNGVRFKPLMLPSKEELSSYQPLSLHLYFGYPSCEAPVLLFDVLAQFASKNLQTLYFCSDPNNSKPSPYGQRPATGRELNHIFNSCPPRSNPWVYLLPQHSTAHETLKTIILDCSLFWSEIAYVLPYLHNLEKLDCEFALLHTEPTFPMPLETMNEAGRRILDACLNSDINLKKEKAFKKNKNMKWIGIKKENIILPSFEPKDRQMPGNRSLSRFKTIKVSVCLQFMMGRIRRSKRGFLKGGFEERLIGRAITDENEDEAIRAWYLQEERHELRL